MFALGEFGDNVGFYRESDWLVFFIAIMFNIILLLNLLIAIISETFAAVAEKAVQNSFKEKVAQIQEMQVSIFGFIGQKADVDSNTLLFLANVKPTDDEEMSTDEKIDSLTEELASVKEICASQQAKLDLLIERLCPDEVADGQAM